MGRRPSGVMTKFGQFWKGWKMAAKNLQKYNCLVIDPDIFMRRILREMLRQIGLGNIDEANDGAQAFSAICQFPYHLVICELVLPVMDGEEFATKVRHTKFVESQICVIGYTKLMTPELVIKARDSGMNEIMTAPFCIGVLEKKVNSSLMSPRIFVNGPTYFGPSRRRKSNVPYFGPIRREADRVVGEKEKEIEIEIEKQDEVIAKHTNPNAASQEQLAKHFNSLF